MGSNALSPRRGVRTSWFRREATALFRSSSSREITTETSSWLPSSRPGIAAASPNRIQNVEASTGFEPAVEVLQPAACSSPGCIEGHYVVKLSVDSDRRSRCLNEPPADLRPAEPGVERRTACRKERVPAPRLIHPAESPRR